MTSPLDAMVMLGFPRAEAKAALKAHKNDISRAMQEIYVIKMPDPALGIIVPSPALAPAPALLPPPAVHAQARERLRSHQHRPNSPFMESVGPTRAVRALDCSFQISYCSRLKCKLARVKPSPPSESQRGDDSASETVSGSSNYGNKSSTGESDARDPEEEERYRIWDLFAEEYHDIVVQLPLEYERAFRLLQELETTQQLAETQTKSTLESYLAAARKDATAEEEDGKEGKDSRGLLEQLVKATRTAVRTGEDKVGLAVALYESVDRHIRRLDADLARSEDSLLIGLRPGTLPSHDAPSASLKSPPGPTTSRGAIALGEMDAYDLDGEADSPKKEKGKSKDGSARKRKREERRRKRKGKGKERAVELEEGETSVPEVPVDVDPTEPTYCYCDKVSYGEMIGCESDDCPREWFHLTCVGLDDAPEGTWYCNDCKASLGITDTTQKKKARKR